MSESPGDHLISIPPAALDAANDNGVHPFVWAFAGCGAIGVVLLIISILLWPTSGQDISDTTRLLETSNVADNSAPKQERSKPELRTTAQSFAKGSRSPDNRTATNIVILVVLCVWIGLPMGSSFLRNRAARKSSLKRSILPCLHGVAGALADSSKCAECTSEVAAGLVIKREQVQTEQQRVENERQRAYHAWLEQVRLPAYLLAMDPRQFEILVCRLFGQMGYQVESTPYIGDGGADGYLYKDGQKIVIQSKRVKGKVGEPILRDLYGTMLHSKSHSAIVVTTGTISYQARKWADDKPIRFIEIQELTTLLESHFAVSTLIPPDFAPAHSEEDFCPKCNKPLRRVRGRRGTFIGCTGYPSCRYTRQIAARGNAAS